MDIYLKPRLEAEARFARGWRPQNLLSAENVKLKKAEKLDWVGLGLSLAPADISGHEVCASRSPECTKHCLFTSGRGAAHFRMSDENHVVWMGRIFRTLWYFRDPTSFMARLRHEIGRQPDAAIRLNVFSDIQWERRFPEIFTDFPTTQFYDYTKHHKRMFRPRPENYHLTFSLHENNQRQALDVLRARMNIAAVTTTPTGWLFGYPVIDGDEHDLRFLDPHPCVVGLKAKGTLKKDPHKDMVYAPEEVFEKREVA